MNVTIKNKKIVKESTIILHLQDEEEVLALKTICSLAAREIDRSTNQASTYEQERDLISLINSALEIK